MGNTPNEATLKAVQHYIGNSLGLAGFIFDDLETGGLDRDTKIAKIQQIKEIIDKMISQLNLICTKRELREEDKWTYATVGAFLSVVTSTDLSEASNLRAVLRLYDETLHEDLRIDEARAEARNLK